MGEGEKIDDSYNKWDRKIIVQFVILSVERLEKIQNINGSQCHPFLLRTDPIFLSIFKGLPLLQEFRKIVLFQINSLIRLGKDSDYHQANV